MDLTRRQVLLGAGGAGALLAGGRAVDNVLLGYGVVTGTNLRRQDLDPLVLADLRPRDGPLGRVADTDIHLEGDALRLVTTDGEDRTVPLDTDLPDASPAVRDAVAGVARDLRDLDRGAATLEYHDYPAFFERLRRADARPLTVGALRGPRRGDPAAVEAVAEVDPARTPELAAALAAGLREHTHYDLPRYLAGSVEDNVLFGLGDLREPFESPTDFEAIADDADSGLFCYELVYRSIEAFHAVAPTSQVVPVLAGYVRDRRHKHAYTALAGAIREAGELVMPVTFLDYTHATLYDDLGVRWLLGDGLDAYTERHRATSLHWGW
ncbi:MAG: hypothetical protein ACLFM8_08405 [Halobacteriales archaeon]